MRGSGGRGTGKAPVIMLCALFAAFTSITALSADGPVRILAHERFRLEADAAGNRKLDNGTLTRTRFDAFGRIFRLALEKNSRLAAVSTATNDIGPSLSLYQGTLENVPGSWVRLSAKAQSIRGLIWDGRELYVVDSADVVGEPSTAGDDTIIFRLADTQIAAGALFCGADSGSGKAAYSSLMNELKGSPAIMQAIGASLRLELSVLGDSLLRARYASDQQARDEILTRLNNVDGIYSSQLGVELQATTLNLNDAVAAQVSATTDANTLIADLATLRSQTASLRARGLTHLFTGRDLDGSTVGIAYTDALCSSRYGAGLTQVSNSVGIDSLITAHEIGHNFGAVHDGDPDKQCAGTPANQYIMSPSVNQNATTFSQCSLNSIMPRIQTASCLLPMSPPDLSVPADLGTRTWAVSKPSEWPLTITNTGGSTAERSRVTLFVPPVVIVDEAWVAGGTCTSGAGIISCEMGDIPAAGTRVVHLTLRSDVVGSNSVAARVSSLADSRSSNNIGDGTLIIAPEVDLATSLEAPATVEIGSSSTLTFTARNNAAIDASAVAVQLTLSSGLGITAAQLENGSCTIDSSTAHCMLTTLAAGQSVNGSLTANATAAAVVTAQLRISADSFDPDAANNAVERQITVVQPAAIQNPGTRRSGGGGSTGILWLLALNAMLACRRRLSRRS